MRISKTGHRERAQPSGFCGRQTRDHTLTEHVLLPTEPKRQNGSTMLDFVKDKTFDNFGLCNAECVVAVVAVIAHPRQLVQNSCASAAPRGGRACAHGAASVAHPSGRGDLLRFGVSLLCVPRAALQDTHVQSTRTKQAPSIGS